jgi:hypothetical protein
MMDKGKPYSCRLKYSFIFTVEVNQSLEVNHTPTYDLVLAEFYSTKNINLIVNFNKMKKIIFTVTILLFGFTCKSQISLDHQFVISGNKLFYITDIGNNDYKYIIMDTTGLNIYNLDYSPYLLNFVPPLPLGQPPSYYEVAYITKSLFDCDSSNLEYVLENGLYPANFYIYRTDGTLLFQQDSVTGPYGLGLLDGSIYQKPIINTPSGTKMFLFGKDFNGHPDTMYIYSLCGELPLSISENSIENSFVKLFPNPSNGIVDFQIQYPNNQEKFIITIYNSSFQRIDEVNINGNNYRFDIKQKSLASGTYLFSLKSNKRVYQTGTFIISQ